MGFTYHWIPSPSREPCASSPLRLSAPCHHVLTSMTVTGFALLLLLCLQKNKTNATTEIPRNTFVKHVCKQSDLPVHMRGQRRRPNIAQSARSGPLCVENLGRRQRLPPPPPHGAPCLLKLSQNREPSRNRSFSTSCLRAEDTTGLWGKGRGRGALR